MLRHAVRWGGLVLALVVVLPAPAADKNKAEPATEPDYRAVAHAGEITGKLKGVNPKDHTLTVEIDVAQLGKYVIAQQAEEEERLLRLEQEMLRTANPAVRAARAQRLAAEVQRAQLQQAKTVNNPGNAQHKDFDFETTDETRVRFKEPPVRHDEKGYVQKYTAQELKELRGDGKLPGYAADWDDLKAGQTVKVTLARPAEKGDKNKDQDNAKKDARPRATVILVTRDAPEANAPAGKK